MVPFRSGVNKELEEIADELIRKSLVGVFDLSLKADIMTPWKWRMRSSHELHNRDGVANSSTRLGMFHRALNRKMSWLNSRDGVAQMGNCKNWRAKLFDDDYQEWGTYQQGHWDPYTAFDVMTRANEDDRESSPFRMRRQRRNMQGGWESVYD